MSLSLIQSNIVVTANQFNPTITNQLWLVDNGIVERDEFRDGCLFSDQLVNVQSENFSMLITPEQLQFVPVFNKPTEQQEVVQSRLGKLVKILEHTPFKAVGLNFLWHFRPTDIEKYTRSTFLNPSSPFATLFENDSDRFGGYFSKDAHGGRMKLDVRPMKAHTNENTTFEFIQFSFNFHFELCDNRFESVNSIFGKFEIAFCEAEKTVNIVGKF